MKHHASALTLVGPVAFLQLACSPSTSQVHFATPDDAVQSLVGAVRTDDRAQLEQILGPDSDEVLNSGDDVADRETRADFIAAYDARHVLVKNPDGTMTLSLGDKYWPMPIPVKVDRGQWVFDTAAGKEEILNRRVGRNELDTIEACQAAVDAQREYAQRDPMRAGIPIYARKFISDSGTKNGLYWPTAAGEPQSPLGPLVGEASKEGYTTMPVAGGQRRPYHGYYYKMLTAQGPSARGGALNYLVHDTLLGGFAIVAWPAEYGNSGIMTFIVNQDEIVYQRDLGSDTENIAASMTMFDPGPDWTKVK
jgi:hypothetical protein